jgi:TPR repeat protein
MVTHMSIRHTLAGVFWLSLLITAPAAALVPAPDALREKAIRYESGEGVMRDYRRAFKLYCLAALEGDGKAAYHLGSMYLNGLGRKTDNLRAAGWFKQAEERGDPDAGRVLVARLESVSPAHDPDCPLVKPQPDRSTIKTWVHLLAPYYNINPELVLSVIQVESNFNARAKSPKNAVGLMQLILPTAERFNVEDVWDPWQNIKGGMAYLEWLKEHFRPSQGRKPGRVMLMLAAYNAGEAAVKRHGGIPPYDETREYVKRAVRIYANYIRARKGQNRSARKYARSNKARSGVAKARISSNRKFSTPYHSLLSIK